MSENKDVIQLASRRDNERIDVIETQLDEIHKKLDNIEKRIDVIEVQPEDIHKKLDRIEKMIDEHCKEKDDDCQECKKEIEDKIIRVLDAANNNLVRVVIALLKNQ